MLGYMLRLAARSVARTPAISVLTMVAIGLGVAVPTAMMSIRHVFAQNPIPEKSDLLYNVRVDSWDADSEFFDIKPGDPPKHITYRDMAGLMVSEIPRYRTGVANARAWVFPDVEHLRPYEGSIRLCHADFFPMFEAPFRYGGGWDPHADDARRRVVVLSHATNQKLFAGRNSVGERVRLGGGELTVVGVLGRWPVTPRYYDIINNQVSPPRDFFVPFDLIREQDLQLTRTGDTDAWGSWDSDDPDAVYTASELTWIQYWVELEPAQVADYHAFVDSYARSQKELGRFPRPINNRVSPVMEWLEVREVVAPEMNAIVIIALLFLTVCALNLVGLLLTKFLAASTTIGVHRALGASRRAVFLQRLIECELIGLAGGAVGVLLAWGSVETINRALPSFVVSVRLVRFDLYMLTWAILLALAAGLISGLYPAWRACRVAPAHQLKLQ
jgi:putative ABC transport system permease protein